MLLTVFWCVLILAVQIALSYVFGMIRLPEFTEKFIDVSGILWNQSGELTIFYTDAVRIAVFLISFIPYVLILMKIVESLVVNPLKKITVELSQFDYEKLTSRLEVHTKYEFTELKDTFNEMFARLEDTDRKKRELEKQKDLLIVGMAHDLKTPITTIRGYSQALIEDVVTDKIQQEEYLRAINRKSVQLEELIELLFDYARLATAQMKLDYENVDLCELLRENIGLFYTEFEEKKIEFKFNIPEKKVMIQADKKQLSRVFANLYTNALKYNHSGDIVSTTLDLTDGIKIYIEDTGEKIPEEIEKHIFQPFVTGEQSSKAGSGTGLGLSIAAKIVEMYHGSLTLEHNRDGIYTKSFVIRFI